MSWDDFEKRLFSTVVAFPSHTILIVGVPIRLGRRGRRLCSLVGSMRLVTTPP